MNEETCGDDADHRDIVVRAVLFAVVSLTAWWCWSSLASAEEAGPEPTAPEPAPVLFPAVVAPLVDAAPAVDPTGVAVLPVADAVTTPILPPVAPVLPPVTAVADQLVGPVVGPAAAPAVGAAGPAVAQVVGAVALADQLVAPAIVPVTGMVGPAVDQVVSAPALPPAGAVTAGQGASDPGQRSSCPLAVLPDVAGATEVPTEALGGPPEASPSTGSGGRPPVTPD